MTSELQPTLLQVLLDGDDDPTEQLANVVAILAPAHELLEQLLVEMMADGLIRDYRLWDG